MKISMLISCLLLTIVASGQDVKLSSKKILTHDLARVLAEQAYKEAQKNGWQVSIAIVDESADLMFFFKMDEAIPASIELAQAKARSAANFREDGKNLNTALSNGSMVLLAIPGMLPLDGGYVLRTVDGEIVGAIGVSGSAAKNDATIALAAVQYLKQIK